VNTLGITEAKAHLSRQTRKLESGEEVVITCHGRPVAPVTAAKQPKKPLDPYTLAEFQKSIPPFRKPAATLPGKMRDEDDIEWIMQSLSGTRVSPYEATTAGPNT
jgi:antitoxin (DNA-binding transcriptional repressor) of toxin-antitoxin stability system